MKSHERHSSWILNSVTIYEGKVGGGEQVGTGIRTEVPAHVGWTPSSPVSSFVGTKTTVVRSE